MTPAAHALGNPELGAPPPSETATAMRGALETLLGSPEFERAERLRSFLTFIVDRTLAGQAEAISESRIAAEVFQRQGYNPQDDSTVRRQAHALRGKLQSYYARVGTAGVRVELPVGRYVPQFRRGDEVLAVPLPERAVAPEAVAPPDPHPPPAGAASPGGRGEEEGGGPAATEFSPAAPGRGTRRLVLAGAAASLFGAGVLAGRRSSSSSSSSPGEPAVHPTLARLWGGWFRAGSTITLCVSTPPTLHVKRTPSLLPGQVPEGLSVSAEHREVLREHFDLPGADLRLHLKRSAMSKYGELLAVSQLCALFAQVGVRTVVQQSRTFSLESFRSQDVVVLGNDENNPWLDQLLDGYPLQLRAPAGKDGRRIVDTTAKGGAVSFSYPAPASEGLEEVFGLVSLLPGLRPERRLMILAGLGNTTTHLTTEFLTDPARGGGLEQALRAANGGALPRHYQAVVKVGVTGRVSVRGAVVLVHPVV